MRDYQAETEKRVAFIRRLCAEAGVTGIVYGNSGGKDCALVGALCKKACDDTVGLILPCGVPRSYHADKSDAEICAAHFNIAVRYIDLGPTRAALESALPNLPRRAEVNIAPRLRMTTVFAVANAENRLVAGTGNRSEGYVGYFTKWGDGACDFNPIADLTVREVYEFLRYLNAPELLFNKPPSAGLFEGQTDETEMGLTYDALDDLLLCGTASPENRKIIEKYHVATEHKRKMPVCYQG